MLELTTAYTQWEALRKIYEPTGRHRLAALLQGFYGYTPKPKTTIDQMATELSNLQADIRLVDKEQAPTEAAKIAVLLF